MNLSRLLGFVLFLVWAFDASGETSQREMVYEVRLAFLDAGELNFKLYFSSMEYSFRGYFETRGLVHKYYRWKGDFAAIGRLESGLPRMERYYARSESKDHSRKFVVLADDGVSLLPPGGKDFEFKSRPKGNDLVTVFFLTPSCYKGKYINDGEDTFGISLLKRKEVNSKDTESASILSCYYRVTDDKGRARKVVVTLVSSIYGFIAKEVRVKLPLLPDIVFNLRN